MRFASLGSGSEGNGLLVECVDGDRSVRLLVDCGFGLREAQRRLEVFGLTAIDLDAILVTHEHGDHVSGAFRLARHAGVPLYSTRGTLRASGNGLGFSAADAPAAGRRMHEPGRLTILPIDPDRPFEIEGVCIDPIAVPHDAREPVQFVFDDGRARFAAMTDLGHASNHVLRAVSRIDALLLECNHDADLLAHSDYPLSLRRRIAGPYGHLSNDSAARMLAELDHSRLRTVCAAHLSRRNNRAELVFDALRPAWGGTSERLMIADQDSGIGWIDV